MKQVLQSLQSGLIEVANVPCPAVMAGHLLIGSKNTVLSSGTERMLVEFGRAGWIERARTQPDRVRQVIEKTMSDGPLATIGAVQRKLEQPVSVGYCNVGVILELGTGVAGFAVGDRVVSNGKHADVVCVPKNVCARIPDVVSDEAAAFTVLGAIGLQGIRLVQPTLGETIVVSGLGLIGLLTVQLLRAHGCKVIGIDFDATRLELARRFGARTVDLAAGEDPVAFAMNETRGRGVDAVIITASTTSSEPVRQAANMCRKRGRIVLVGVTGLELSRADFYEKELTFQVSCSYGPGRYDPEYEEKGHDYPIGYVRWTEQRNFEAVLDMLADERLDVGPLISHRFRIEDAAEAYDLIAGGAPSLGVVLEYGHSDEAELRKSTVSVAGEARGSPGGSGREPTVGFIGAGNYASGVLIPAFAAAGARLRSVASAQGVSAVVSARRHRFELATTDVAGMLSDPALDAVIVTTRHDSHADLTVRALEAGKHVFVEKPMALALGELEAVQEARSAAIERGQNPVVMVGFNRRFSPFAVEARRLRASVPGPVSVVITVNAGSIPASHWTQDRAVGGGRIIGEACHFIDLARFLVGAPIQGWQATAVGGGYAGATVDDCVGLLLRFGDGSTAAVQYLANGHRAFPKERVEVFGGGRILQIDNFRSLKGWGWKGFRGLRRWRQDKGQVACAKAFLDSVREGRPPPVDFDELVEVSRVTIEVAESLG